VRLDRILLALLAGAVGAGFGLTQPAPPKPAAAPAPPPDLTDYVRKADSSFAWKRAGTTESDTGTVYDLDLTSQTWHDIVWTHKLQVFLPKAVKNRGTVVLWNQGGNPGPTSTLIGFEIARKVGVPVAFLYGVPNQPLFGGKKEDALIAETFVKYLETKDPTWPLLFPMVKSVVRAMDAVQAFAAAEWKTDVTGFVVTGASKRGWTTWLTAATGDPRVKAIAPLVIDTLNFPVQMKNQLAAFGKPSEMIRDYTERKLVPIPDTAEGRKLWSMVDPWVYRDKVTVPKLIVNGTNDPYWPLDATNSYWDDLKGEKYLLYVPNAGHDLREADKDGKKQLIPERALNTLSAFCRSQAFGTKMPTLTWKYIPEDKGVTLEVGYEGTLKSQRAWTAEAETRDFRKSRWTEDVFYEAKGDAKVVVSGLVKTTLGFPFPKRGFRAVVVETEFETDGLKFPLSTQIRILSPKQ